MTVSVRYIVHDVDDAIGFYCNRLGFEEVMHPAPMFAMLRRGELRLLLSSPGRPGAPVAGRNRCRTAPGPSRVDGIASRSRWTILRLE
jgi:catechol 2,3-dioxygenase-like lactoylglutathione lyase family enzyme